MNRLTTFLNSPCAKTQGGSYTHTSMAGGKYYVHCEHQEQFFDLYKAALVEGKRVPSLIEKHKDFSPALIDFDLRFPAGQTERAYTLEHVKTFMRKYLEVLGQYVDLSVARRVARSCAHGKANAPSREGCHKGRLSYRAAHRRHAPERSILGARRVYGCSEGV